MISGQQRTAPASVSPAQATKTAPPVTSGRGCSWWHNHREASGDAACRAVTPYLSGLARPNVSEETRRAEWFRQRGLRRRGPGGA